MAERPVKFCLHLQDQPGNTISSIDIIEVCQEQLPPQQSTTDRNNTEET